MVALFAIGAGGMVPATADTPTLAREPETSEPSLWLQNVRIFDTAAGCLTEAQDILTEGRIILAVRPAAGPAPGVEQITPSAQVRVIPCAGKVAVPGLFDCHTHLSHLKASGADSMQMTLAEFARRGVLYVRDVGGPIDLLSDLRGRIAGGDLGGPEIFYTGPMLEGSPLSWAMFNEQLPGFTVAIDTPADVDSLLPELSRRGACIIKTFNRIDAEVYRHLVEVARRCSLGIVHDPGTPLFHAIPMDEALRLGVTSFEHAKAPWPVVLRDDLRQEHDSLTGPDTQQMARMMFMTKIAGLGAESISLEKLQALGAEMVARGAYLCPTLHVLADMEAMSIRQIKQRQGVDELPAEMLAMIRQSVTGMQQVSRLCTAELARTGVKMLVGQDGCRPEATFTEMELLAESGIPPAEILKGATLYPARWLGEDDRFGAIAPGKEASFVILEENPLDDITHVASAYLVIQHGRIVRQ